MSWLFLLGAILVEVAASRALRASDGLRRRRWVLPVAVGHVVAFGFLSLALRAGMAVGVAYGTWAAVVVSLTAVLARVMFGEPLTNVTAAGSALIAGGVVLVEFGSGSLA